MPNFLIASLYADRDIDLGGSTVSALTVFDALIKDCMTNCGVEEWEACQLLETESWNAVVWRVDADGQVLVPFTDRDLPWGRINALTDKIFEMKEALALVGKLEILSEVPGMGTVDLAPVREMLVELEVQRTNISDAWEKRKAKPPDNVRQLRSVQVDPPEEDNDAIPF